MAAPRIRVPAPAPAAPHHGLFDVAEVVTDSSDNWRTGIEYDTINCADAKLWGEWCTGTGLPIATPVVRTIAVTFTGTGAVGGPYSITASATVDGGQPRSIAVQLHNSGDTPQVYLTTGGAAQPVAEGLEEPFTGHAAISDVLTGVSINVDVVQAEDGSITTPATPVLIAVDEPGVPAGCDQITATFTATANTDNPNLADVSVTATTTATDPRELAIYVGSRRVVIDTGAAAQPVVAGVATGIHRIAVRDNRSWSYVSGWMHIGDDGTGTATLIASTCPVKEITSPPWQTIYADPFTIFAEAQCKSLGFSDAASAVEDTLELSANRAVERRYWETLAPRAQDVTGASAVDPVRGLAELEQYIAAAYTGMGVLHTSPFGVAYLARNRLIYLDGDELRTWRGTPVVVGAGYGREGSADAVEGDQFWLFITGSIVIRQSEINAYEALDKYTNDLSALAERTVVIIDDCPQPAKALVSQAVTA
jgi:hypothetical protein